MKTATEDRTYLATWRSDEAEREYRQLDEAAWRQATNSPPEAIDVATSFGSTRAYRWPGEGPAIVFLHGMGDTSIRWVPYAEQLNEFDVYAIDIMGDVGRSTPTIGFTDSSDYASWMAETMDGLNLVAPTVVGESLGGYVALVYTVGNGRVRATVALEPLGIVKLRLASFTLWGLSTGLAGLMPEGIRQRLARSLRQPLVAMNEQRELYAKGYRSHPPKVPPQPIFTDEQLQSIATPVRVVAAAKSAAFNARQMVERVNSTVPLGEAVLVPDAGHSLSMGNFDECLAAIRTAMSESA